MGREPWTTSEFVIRLFAILVFVVLASVTAAAIVLSLFTNKDVHDLVDLILQIIRVVIAALVGFLAGRRLNGHS